MITVIMEFLSACKNCQTQVLNMVGIPGQQRTNIVVIVCVASLVEDALWTEDQPMEQGIHREA